MPYKDPIKKKEHAKKYYQNNKNKLNERSKKWSKNNRKKCTEYQKKWRENNREKYNKIWMKYYYKNKKSINQKNVLYQRKRKKIDFHFKIKLNIKRRILLALKGTYKSAPSLKLTGAPSWEFVWAHLEKQFKPGMTKENHGLWHIDHVLPCSSFDLTKPEEQAKCFHYTNLQPLWASENLSKGNRIS
jgi:hypothetical protein